MNLIIAIATLCTVSGGNSPAQNSKMQLACQQDYLRCMDKTKLDAGPVNPPLREETVLKMCVEAKK